jgi:catechol 2,3-dioxygenase-like lactoylglutathione lyase family enzyme
MSSWISSTLIFVHDVDSAISFYVDLLGFTLNMRYEEKGQALVAGVSRGDGCALLLTSQWPDKVGTAVLYTALDGSEFESLRSDLTGKGVPRKDGWWGKPLMIVEDRDGNQLYFPLPDRAAPGA